MIKPPLTPPLQSLAVLSPPHCSADSLGDMFFDMLEVLPFPLACPNGTSTMYPRTAGRTLAPTPRPAGPT